MAKRLSKKTSSGGGDSAELARTSVALLACIARGLKESGDIVQVMDAFGVSSPMIANALGISPISVRTALHRRRRAAGHR